jgi:hypothetical protein
MVRVLQPFGRGSRLIRVGLLSTEWASSGNGVLMIRKLQHRRGSRLATGLFLGSAIVLAACGSTNASSIVSVPRGVIYGTADMCSGAAGEPPHNVQARLLEGKRFVDRQTHLGNGMFRFSVPPGRYTVTSDQSYDTPVHVNVGPGESVHVEVYSDCS